MASLDPLLKNRTALFWTLHIGGWLAYALSQYLGTLLYDTKYEHMPKSVVSVVSMMGRVRVASADSTAERTVAPARISLRAWSTSRMALFTTRPMKTNGCGAAGGLKPSRRDKLRTTSQGSLEPVRGM